jgi:copper chaperone CopZ
MSDAELVLTVEGMSCGGCVVSVEKALAAVPGVKHVEVDLTGKRATVRGAALERERLVRAVYDAGYDAR